MIYKRKEENMEYGDAKKGRMRKIEKRRKRWKEGKE